MFIGQLDLEELNAEQSIAWLPDKGRLLFFAAVVGWPAFFYYPTDREDWFVLYDKGIGETRAVRMPEDMRSDVAIKSVKYLKGVPTRSLPDYERLDTEKYKLSEEERWQYLDVVEKELGQEPFHQISGYPYAIQNDAMEEECQASGAALSTKDQSLTQPKPASRRNQNKDWKLLFQFDSDSDINVEWGDAGMLYFWIRESDAKNMDFSKTWLLFECF